MGNDEAPHSSCGGPDICSRPGSKTARGSCRPARSDFSRTSRPGFPTAAVSSSRRRHGMGDTALAYMPE